MCTSRNQHCPTEILKGNPFTVLKSAQIFALPQTLNFQAPWSKILIIKESACTHIKHTNWKWNKYTIQYNNPYLLILLTQLTGERKRKPDQKDSPRNVKRQKNTNNNNNTHTKKKHEINFIISKSVIIYASVVIRWQHYYIIGEYSIVSSWTEKIPSHTEGNLRMNHITLFYVSLIL